MCSQYIRKNRKKKKKILKMCHSMFVTCSHALSRWHKAASYQAVIHSWPTWPRGLKTPSKCGKCNYFYETEKATKKVLAQGFAKEELLSYIRQVKRVLPLSLSLAHERTHAQTHRFCIGQHVVKRNLVIKVVRGTCIYKYGLILWWNYVL
jgi:hypothetical protein